MATPISRRNLFRLKPGDLLELFRESRRPKQSAAAALRPIRPPGALPTEEEFLATCQRCQNCSVACPYGVIQHLGPLSGEAEGTPILSPNENPCRWCPTMDCIQACPSGALAFGPDEAVAPIGKAVLSAATCLNEQGTLCDDCAMHCPPTVKAITMVERKPRLDAERCVGCGLCAYYCASTPVSLRVIPLQRRD